MPHPIDPEDFWSHVLKGEPDECWPWLGNIHRTGYGRYHGEKAHRIAYELAKTELGDLWSLHHCDNPPCCNPAHLFAGTALDNVRDCIAKGRFRGGGGRKPNCPRGHAYEPDNFYVTSSGSRQCKICQRARAASRHFIKKCEKADAIKATAA